MMGDQLNNETHLIFADLGAGLALGTLSEATKRGLGFKNANDVGKSICV